MPQQQVDPLSFILFLPFYLLNFMTSTLPSIPQMPAPVMPGNYHNTEEWIIKEMPDGTVKMVIHRNARRG